MKRLKIKENHDRKKKTGVAATAAATTMAIDQAESQETK